MYTFASAIEQKGSKVEFEHFVSYSRTAKDTVMMYDDHIVSKKVYKNY